jgi:putative redox protein
MTKPPVIVDLGWEGDLRFSARSGDQQLTIDSASAAGPSPMQAVGFGLAGCMAIDVIHILTKGRHIVRGLTARLTGVRRDDEPRHFVRIDLHFVVNGHVPDAAVARAVSLSREKYCSVWHSMRQDIDLNATWEITQPEEGALKPSGLL